MQQMRGQGQDIAPFFEANSVALIGASEREGSLGKELLNNLAESGFHGPIYPVNPKYETVLEKRCFQSIKAIGAPVDLAVIVTPAAAVPGILEDCGAAGVPAAIILSAGFRETGEAGRELEQNVLSIARQHGIRFIGPNCLGVMRPDIGLNATFSHTMANPGRIALVSQSGAMCTAMLDWAAPRNVGFSCVVSSGIAADVDFGEILDYLVFDPATLANMLYIEGIHDARRFMSALRAAARAKPVIVMKAGRYSEGSKAAVSHTGALVGSSGAILSYIMCRAMNRKFLNVIAGGFGTGGGSAAAAGSGEEQGEVVPIEAAETAELLSNAKEVMIIPGYGMAVAQAQHTVRDLANALEARGVEVHETSSLDEVIGSSDVIYWTRVQEERFADKADRIIALQAFSEEMEPEIRTILQNTTIDVADTMLKLSLALDPSFVVATLDD